MYEHSLIVIIILSWKMYLKKKGRKLRSSKEKKFLENDMRNHQYICSMHIDYHSYLGREMLS